MVIAIASSYILKCKSDTGWSRLCPLVGKCKLFVYRKVHNFQMVYCVKNFLYQLQTDFNRTLKGLKCVPQTHCK